MKIFGLLLCFALIGCSNNQIPDMPKAVELNTTLPVATFETSEKNRQRAREQGLPVLLLGKAARYPSDVKPAELGHGWVQLDIEVRANGDVGKIKILDRSNPLFEQPAIEAVRSWKFEASSSDSQFVHRLFIRGTQATHYQPTIQTQ